MSTSFTKHDLYCWCKVPWDQLENHPDRKVPLRLVKDSAALGQLMAEELAAEIRRKNDAGEITRAIIPCGQSCWYKPFTDLVNKERLSLRNFVVFHMDECLD